MYMCIYSSAPPPPTHTHAHLYHKGGFSGDRSKVAFPSNICKCHYESLILLQDPRKKRRARQGEDARGIWGENGEGGRREGRGQRKGRGKVKEIK